MRWLSVAGLALAACCPSGAGMPASASGSPVAEAFGPGAPAGAAWRQARAELAELRAVFAPPLSRTVHVRLAMEHAPTGRRLQARGAVAVGRGDGLRMILVGPGGTTALDLLSLIHI